MKLGIEWNYKCTGSIEEQVRCMKSCGFDATFLEKEEDRIEEIMHYLDKYDITCENYHAPFDHINDMWMDGSEGEIMLSRLCKAIDLCAKYKIPVLVVHLSSGKTPPRMCDVGFDRYDRLIKYSAQRKVTIAFENIRRLDNVAYALENYEDVGFCWDVGHEACYTPDIRFMPLFGKRIVSLHLHDNTGIYDQDVHWLPYSGVINMDKTAKYLAESPYQGAVMLEVLPSTAGIDNMKEFYQKAYEVARRFANAVEQYRKSF